MFQIFKISFRQIFSNAEHSSNKFILYFSIASLSLCLTVLILALSFSQGFKDKVNLNLSSIDGHYRILETYNPEKLTPYSFESIKQILNRNSVFLSHSAYTEDYVLANIKGESEGLLIYGIDLKESMNILNISIPYFENNGDNEVIPISIGSILAENYSLNLGDTFLVFPIKMDDIRDFPVATKVKVSYIFNSGFSEYDRSVGFMDLKNSRSLFNYGFASKGIIGTVQNPMEINNDFSKIFNEINTSKYRVVTWIDRHERIFKWLQVYSDPIFFIIFLIIILAIFNMSLSLWILAQDKLKEMSILLTLGFTKVKIASILILQNIILNIFSILISVFFSVLLLFLQYNYQLIKISEKIYFVNHLPVGFDCLSIAKYYLLFFFISIFISFIPAFRLYSINIIKNINANG